MKNKFIKELALRLLPITSFSEMQGILEDYSGFMGEGEFHEKPKDVVKSLDIDKRKGYITSIIYFALLVVSFFAMNNYLCDDPIEIRLLCENGKATFSYDHATVTYKDGTVETASNNPDDMFKYTGGKDYWGFQHAVQIRQFYNAVQGKEELEISGREALKIQNIICQIYDNNDNPFK